MERWLLYLLIVGFTAAIFTSCGKDNYDAPSAKLTGKVTYNGQPVGVRGSNQSVRLQLWQDGFALRTPIDVYVTQDGSFSSMLFDGTYKLITVSGTGPWSHSSDTVVVQVNGNTEIGFPVRPYFALSGISYTLEGTDLTATLTVDQIDQTRSIEDISLLVGDTKFVDLGHFTKQQKATLKENGTLTIRMNVEEQLANNSALFARVAVKINGITEAVYDSETKKIK
ncbi:DUF3823 domain-containing protein [Sphingobacterium deserti]|nr:DUF3823 domain-containing protein [Sphingobacterium deserti]